MKKKNKLIFLLIVLFILLITVSKIFNISYLQYKIEDFNIKETCNENYYYFEIKNKNLIYPINIYNIEKDRKIINKIYSYSADGYDCILPLFNNKVLTDLMCYYKNTLYNYQSIKGENESLDAYVKEVKEYTKYNNKNTFSNKFNNTINFYNYIENIVSITTYKGIIVDGKEIKLFDKDVYNNTISTFINNYYIVADYNKTYEFSKFYIVNLLNKEVSTIETKNEISYDSYIQGIVDNSVYLYDKDNEVQYEINMIDKKINITSSNNYVKYYTNNKWEKMNVSKANKKIYFNYETLENNFTDYDYVYENEYYYYLIDSNNKLYRVNKNNIDVIQYLIDVPTSNIKYKDNYLYYVYEDELYFYSDITGLNLILTNSEFEFNKTIKYYIY